MWINCGVLFFVVLFISVHSEIIDVELLTEDDVEAHRVNRDLSRMPEQLVFRIRRNNEKAILRLSKVPPINTSVLRKDGQHFISQEHKDLAAYSDYSCKAVILITRKTQTSNFYNLEGHVQVGVRLVDIKPSDDGSHHVITKQEILTYTTKGNYEHHRSKRSLQIYTVEVGFVADYQNFFSFFGRNNDNLALAEVEMRNYYAFIAEKLKVRYHHINEVDETIAIDIVTSGLIIVEDRDKATFSEAHVADGVVEASIMLNATLSWISNPPTGTVLPPSDHFMFFTGYNLQHAESLSNAGDGRMDSPGFCAQYCSYIFMENITKKVVSIETMDKRQVCRKSVNMEKASFQNGLNKLIQKMNITEVVTDAHVGIAALMSLAYTGVICIEDKYKDLSKSSSIVEDHRDGETGVTASHELGHALNLSHDGDIGCKNSDSYIMSGNAVFIQDAAQAQRPWQFSNCSVRDLKAFVQRSDVNCLGDNRYGTGVVTSVERPGQYFSVNEQCAMKYGDGSTLGCSSAYNNDKDMLCYLLWCTNEGQCSSARVMEYTTCDVNRWCHRGLCIKANNTEPVFVNLPETMDVSSNTQGVLLTVQTFDPDVEDVMTFHITWDPPTIADYLEFNQNTKQVVLKQGRSLTTLTISNFSLIMSVDDGLLLTLPVNVDFVLKQPTALPPAFTNPTYTSSVSEGNAGDVIIQSLINSVTDPDSSSFTFSLQPGDKSEYFSVNSSTGQITFNQRYDYDPTRLPNSVNLTVQVQDPTSLTDTATFALTIQNVDQPSEFLNLPFTVNVAEDTVPGHIIYDVGATDPDSEDVLRYSFTNPSAFVAKYLEIKETTGEINLKTTARIDFESLSTHTYQISVTVATDFNTIAQILTINIKNKNEPPTFSQTSYSISTTTGSKNKVIVSGNEMTSFVSDPDRGDGKSFQILTGDFNYLFSIDRNTGQITYAQDYSTNRNIHPPQVNLTVEVTDTGKLSAVAVFIVNVQALNIPPVISNLPDSVQLLENSSPGTSLLTLQIEDPNIGDTHTYQITGVQPSSVPADLFAISTGGVLLVNNGAIINFETLPETGIYVTVRVNDGKVSSNPKTVTVTIVNVNEAPKFTASKYFETVDEGKAGTVLVPSLIPSVTDEDANDTLTFSLVPSEYSLHFNIDSKTGAISFKGDYDTDPARLPNTVDLFVIARDSGLLFDETDFKFTIQNINQKPIFTNLPQTITVSSQTNGGTEFFSVRASDVDTTDTLVIDADLATSGASQYFNFNKSAGSLSMKSGTISTTDQLFTITFTVTDGQLTESSNLTVNFIYVPEATSTEQPGTGSTTQELITTQPPHMLVIINLPALIQIPENYATKFVIYLIKTNARDPTKLSFNFTQTPANLPTLFTITKGGSLSVKEGSVLDYETLPSLITLSIQATEGEFISIPEFLNITIADINEPAKFNQTKYNFTVTEGKAGEFLIDSFLPFIQDPDRNEKFTFAIVPSPFSDKFRINESTGAISFAEDFDAVKLTQQVNLNIIVKDSSFGFQTTSISFDIKLLNRPPVFLNLPLSAEIQRTMQVGDKIIEIQVSDPNTKDKLDITVTGYIDTDSSQLTFNTNDNTVYLGDVSLFNNDKKIIGLELTVTDGQLSTNTTLIITITNTSRTTTELLSTTELPTTLITTMVTNQPPTSLTTNLSKQPPNSSTTTTQAPENTTDSFESLLRRPWVIAIFGVLGILIPSLIIVVICVIYKRRKQAQAESLTSDPADYDNVEVDQSQKSRIIRPAYHSGFYANPESERQKVYIED